MGEDIARTMAVRLLSSPGTAGQTPLAMATPFTVVMLFTALAFFGHT